MRYVRALGGLLVVALTVSACSAGDDRTDDALPFDAVLIELLGTTKTDAYLLDTERRAAELVVECMQDAGFEFQIPPVTPTFDTPDPTDREAAQDQGFGIIAGYRYQLSQMDFDRTNSQDPNVTYLSTLPQSEINRFFLTLDGAEVEPGQRSGDGCNVTASDEAYADWSRFIKALPNYTALGEERDSHPEWLAARAIWQDCMVERGFEYSEPDAIRSDVISRMRETVNEVYPGGQVPVVRAADGFTVDPEVDALLDELVQFERDAAVANIECTEPIADQFRSVERLVQQEYVDRHRDAIDTLLAEKATSDATDE